MTARELESLLVKLVVVVLVTAAVTALLVVEYHHTRDQQHQLDRTSKGLR